MWWCSKKNTDCKLEIFCCESFNLKDDAVVKLQKYLWISMLYIVVVAYYFNINFILEKFLACRECFFWHILYLCNRIRFYFLENFSEFKNKKVSKKENFGRELNNKT